MEIKQGDKVRVSKDAPEVYLSSVNNLFKYHVCKVEETDGDSAKIRYTDIGIDRWLAIPTKYLIKVDAEAKEPKFKVGDWVKIGETPNPQLNCRVGIISQIDKEGYKISFNDGFFTIVSEEDLTLADEPTEQTEAEKQAFALGERVVTPYGCGVIGKDIEGKVAVVLESGGYCGIDNANKILTEKTDTDWAAYTADLAKEIALKVANKYNDPEQAAEYAVRVAKAVVGNLKQK